MSLIAGLTNQTIDYVYSTTIDGYNDVTRTLVYTDLPCRWQPKLEVIYRGTSEEKTSRVQVWIEPSYTIGDLYEFVQGSETYKVGIKEDKYDLDGQHDHIKLYLV